MSDIQEGRLYAADNYTSRRDWKKTNDNPSDRWNGAKFAKVVGEVNVDKDAVHDWGGVVYAAQEHTQILEAYEDGVTVLYEGPVRQGKRRRFVRAPAFVTQIQGRGKMIKVHIDGVGNPYEVRHPNDGHDPFRRMDGADLILQERAHQIYNRGYDPDHDTAHGADTLLDAAVSVLGGVRSDRHYSDKSKRNRATYFVGSSPGSGVEPWPFAVDYSDHPLYSEGQEIKTASKDSEMPEMAGVPGITEKIELEAPEQQIHALAVAGALIAAEIDRIIESEYRDGNPLKPSGVHIDRDEGVSKRFMGVNEPDELTVYSGGQNVLDRKLPF